MPAASGECVSVEKLEDHFREQLTDMVKEHGFPGFSYAAASSDRIIFSGGIGVRDRESEKPITGDTIFQVGSITKSFTGLLFAELVASDRINMGAPLEAGWFSIEETPSDQAGNQVTLHALATHTAGFPRYPENLDREDGDPILGYSEEQMGAALAALSIEDQYPTEWSYSNFGYGVLAQAMSAELGLSVEELMKNNVTQPLGLKDTTFTLNEGQTARLATPYRDDDTSVATQPWEMGSMMGAGGLFSTAEDLAAFAKWQLATGGTGSVKPSDKAKYLQRAPLYRFTKNTKNAYGLGFFVVDDYVEDIDVLWHGGDVDGYAGALVILPDEDIAFTYLTNSGFATGFSEFQSSSIEAAARLCSD